MYGRFHLELGAEAAGFGEGHSLPGTSLRRARLDNLDAAQ
jgi:hypothetical protein